MIRGYKIMSFSGFPVRLHSFIEQFAIGLELLFFIYQQVLFCILQDV